MKPIVNGSVSLNSPSNLDFEGQDFLNRVEEIKAQILSNFLETLPSNYVSATLGPNYTLQYEVIAEQIAKYHVTLEVFYGQRFYGSMSSEVLLSELGQTVFPYLKSNPLVLDGDVSYRDFLRNMLGLLLKGSKIDAIQEGVNLITDAQIDVFEGYLKSNDPKEIFSLYLEVHKDDYSAFPSDPIANQNNINLILRALKPAHVIYEYRHVFKEVIEPFSNEDVSSAFDTYHYEEARHNFKAFYKISGETGWFVSNSIFRAFENDLINVEPNISSLLVEGVERKITEVFSFIDDSTPRAFKTSPTGLEGTATFSDNTLISTDTDLKSIVKGEKIEVLGGVNLGVYTITTLLDSGEVGYHNNTTGTYGSVKVEPLFLKLEKSIFGVTFYERHSYDIILNPKGKASVFSFSEDVSDQFEGDPLQARDYFKVQRTPIVSTQGDSALAKIKDVSVFVNGVEVEVSEISPLSGLIKLAEPLTLGQGAQVQIDYRHTPNPSQKYALKNLNEQGFALNQNPLNEGSRPPIHKRVAHRHISLEADYTSYLGQMSLNDTTGLSLLNKYNIVSSGEFINDITPESAHLFSVSKEYLSLLHADMRADRIYRVLVEGVSVEFVFDRETQTIRVPSLTGTDFEADVYFPPAKPITETYIKSQPLESSPHLLTEGTPPFKLPSVSRKEYQIESEGEPELLTIADDGGSASEINVGFGYTELMVSQDSSATPKNKSLFGGLFILGGGSNQNYSVLSSNDQDLTLLSPQNPLSQENYTTLRLKSVFTDLISGVEEVLEENGVGEITQTSAVGYLTQLGEYTRLNTYNTLNSGFNLEGGAPLNGDESAPLAL